MPRKVSVRYTSLRERNLQLRASRKRVGRIDAVGIGKSAGRKSEVDRDVDDVLAFLHNVFLHGLRRVGLRSGLGGVKNMGKENLFKLNAEKAKKIYDVIDASGFDRGTAVKEYRSNMNVTWRLPTEELEAQFVKEAAAAGMKSLKGHRSVGGIRASIYNAFPMEGVDCLVSFMKEFEKKNG